MAGFNTITGDEAIMNADNCSFDGTARGGKLTTDGQLFIGSTASPHIKKGSITSPLGTITVGYSTPNITLDLAGGSGAIDSIHPDAFTPPGTDPILPTVAGLVNMTGAQVASGVVGANVIRTDSLAANTMTIEIQRSASNATTDSTKNGVAHFDSARFSVDSNGFVTASGTGLGETITGNDSVALSPTAGNWNILGASAAAGSSPVVTSGAASTLTVNVQTAQAIASTDATKIGLAAFNSGQFSVDANGFVSSGGTVATTYNTQSGTATPSGGVITFNGGPGVTTSASGSTVTINSVTFNDRNADSTLALNNGFFSASAMTATLPSSPTQGTLCIVTCATASAIVVQASTGKFIRIGSLLSSSAGTVTSTSIGDSIELRYRTADTTWYAVSVIGTWVVA